MFETFVALTILLIMGLLYRVIRWLVDFDVVDFIKKEL